MSRFVSSRSYKPHMADYGFSIRSATFALGLSHDALCAYKP